MDLVPYLALIALQGLLIGGFARLALPGPDPMGVLETLAVGLAGSLAGGLVVYAVEGEGEGPGFLVSVVFATLIVYVVRRRRGGSLSDPGQPRD